MSLKDNGLEDVVLDARSLGIENATAEATQVRKRRRAQELRRSRVRRPSTSKSLQRSEVVFMRCLEGMPKPSAPNCT